MTFKLLLPLQPMTSKRRMQYSLQFVGYRRIYRATIGSGRLLITGVVVSELAVNSYLIKPKRNYFSNRFVYEMLCERINFKQDIVKLLLFYSLFEKI